jgi:siroheme synthase-like protein
MPHFPLFVELEGQLCVLIGDGEVAERKARTLIRFGCRLTVIAPLPGEAMLNISRKNGVTLYARQYGGPQDLKGAALVAAATNDKAVNARVARDAAALGIPANVADDARLCTFFFPALVKRGNLVAGISTSGGCPRLASRLRERLEKDWPESITEDVEYLKNERGRLREKFEPDEVLRRLDLLISEILRKYYKDDAK